MLKKKFPSLASIGSDGNTTFLRAARAGHLDKVLDQLKNNVDINTCNANGLNALHLASKDGHINVVSELLKRGAKVDSATKKGNTALHIASLAGQEDVVKHLVEHGACVNVQSQNGFTPLYMAAQENHDAVVRFLLANGANQSLATEDGFTPLAVAMQQGHDKVVTVLLENDTRGKVRLPALHIAAKKDDTKAAALLLQNEHNPDVTSKSGFTPLHIASHYGNEAIANLLLSKGADVNYAAKHNITPLHVAAKWGKANMVSVLLSRGANIEAKTRDGLTPLHCAARSGHEQVVDMLLERGAPISAKTKNGLAALHMSSQGDHVDAARILLYHRAPVDDVTVDYLTALHVAAHCGHVGVARLLLDRKADPNARALNGFTPLHIACKKNRIKVVELLLKHGASIEATTESGLTPLHVASFMGCMNIVIYLVQNEAGPDVKTVRGETPLHLAARANQTDIIRILLRNGAQVDATAREQQTPLHIASRLGNVDIVMLLLQHGASVDSTTKDLYTALHIAAKEGQDEVASVLLENGASLESTTKKGFTPLHLAAKYGHMNVAKLLLRRDAPVDAQGKNGVTPLHVASHYDHQNVALLLLEKGASPHATAKNGHTPLHIAARKNQMDIATTLLEYGAKASAESKAGFTPLHLSAQEGHADMSNLLIEHQADVNHKAKNGLTPLHLCAQEDRVEVGGILLKNQAEVNSTTKAGYTPLHVACHFGQMGMVRLLLANGASVTPTTAVNYTPLHQAAQQGHSVIVNELLAAGADPNATTNQGQTAMSIAQKLGYISVMETLKSVTDAPISPTSTDEKYKVVSPETMQETFMSDSEDEGGEDTMLSEQPYHYLTVDEMRGLGDDSLPIDVTRDERDNRDMDEVSPQHMKETYTSFAAVDNVDINRHPLHVGFLVSFLVDARGGAMRGVRHSGVRVIVPPRRASMPLRVTCRYLKRDKLPHPPPLMEGEALASRILELGPVGAKFLGPVMIEVPHFGSLRGKEREIVILRSDNGETWREHTFEATEEAVHDVLSSSFEKDEIAQFDENSRMTRILTTEFPHYIAVVSRVRQEVHAIGPEGGMVSSTVVPQVQAVFPHGALTKKIKVGLQAQPIPADLTAKLLGNRVAVSPIVTVEPRRRKFHKPISLTIPVPQAANKGMINQYSGDAPTLRLLCSITGGTTRAQWEDVTGSTPLTFVNDCVSFTTTVSARFWLMDCRNISEATKMATELYREAIHVPFMAKFVVFAKRVDTTEARLRVFCMTDDKEDKTLEHQEHFTEVAKSRDVEVLEGKVQYLEFAGNLVPVTKSGDQLQLGFRAFKENRLPFTVRVKDPHADAIGRTIFMREPKVAKGDVPQQPICILNIVLPEEIIPEPDLPEHEAHKHSYITHTSGLQRLSDISNLLGEDWVRLAGELGVSTSEVNSIKTELCESSVAHQGLAMLRLWLQSAGNKASASALEQGLRNIGRDDIIQQTVFQTGTYALSEELSPSYTTKQGVFKRIPGEKQDIVEEHRIEERVPKEGERTPKIEESVPKKDDRRLTIDKDDGDEKKYVAEEKVVEEESHKSVSDRKKEIEKRLSQDIDDITKEKNVTKETKTTTKEIKTYNETVTSNETIKTTTTKDIKTEKSKQFLEEKTEKETAEEKAVSPEPAHLSFDEKRKSFEMGIDPKEKIKQQDSITQSFLEEEKRTVQEQVMETTKERIVEKKEEEEKELTFAEKRRSFEQGLLMKQPGDTLPAAERKQEVAIDRKAEEEKKASDFRRDSLLFQDVSQGLENIEKGIAKPTPQGLLSPGASRTPPPSPAEFAKDAPDNKKWSVETTSSLLSGEDNSKGTGKSKEAVDSSWQSRKEPKAKDEKEPSDDCDDSIQLTTETKRKEKDTSRDAKSGESKTDEFSAFKKESGKQLSPQKNVEKTKKVIPKQKSPSPDKETLKKKSPSPEKEIQMKKSPSPEKEISKKKSLSPEKNVSLKEQVGIGKSAFGFQQSSADKTGRDVKTTTTDKSEDRGRIKKGKKEDSPKKQQDLEDEVTKRSMESSKGPSPDKKTGLLGKTLETMKKPFQDKGEDKGKSKGKSKLKDKSTELSKSHQEGSFEEPGKPQAPETKTTSAEEAQQERLGEKSTVKQCVTLPDQATLVGEIHYTKSPKIRNEKTIDKEKHIDAQETITEKALVDEPLLEKTVQPSVVPKIPARVEEDKDTVPVPKEETNNKGKGNGKVKGNPKPPVSQRSSEKEVAQGTKVEVKDAAKDIAKPLPKVEQKARSKGTQEKEKNRKQKGKDKNEETTEQVDASGEVTSKIVQEMKEASPEPKSKGKDKQVHSAEGKTQKLGLNLVGKAVDVIKKPFQDQSKKNAEWMSNQKEGKGKKQKSIESNKSPSEEKDSEPAKSSTMFIEMEQSMEGKTKPVEEVKAEEPASKRKDKEASPEKPGFVPPEKTNPIPQEKPTSTIPEKIKATSPEKTPKAAPKSTKDQVKPVAPKEEKAETKSPTKEQKKKGKGKNKQKSPPESPVAEKGDDIKTTKQGKKLGSEKQPTIEKAVEIVTRTFIDKPEDHKSEEPLVDQEFNTSKTEILIKELSQEESGKEIEGKSIDLVTLPLGYAVTEEEKSETKADKLMKELSVEKSGEIIEKGAIDLVAKPLQDLKSTSTQKIMDTQKIQKDEFEHIKKTIDDAKFKLDQFKGIVSDKSSKQSLQSEKDPAATGEIIPKHKDQQGSEGTSRMDTQAMEMPGEKEEDFTAVQKTFEQSFKLNPSETATMEGYILGPPRLSLEFGATENAAAGAVDSIVREAKKITVDNMEGQCELHRTEQKVITETFKTSDGQITGTEENMKMSFQKDVADMPQPIMTTKGNMRSTDEVMLRIGQGCHGNADDFEENSLKSVEELRKSMFERVDATATEKGAILSQSVATNIADNSSCITLPLDTGTKVLTETVKQISSGGIASIEKAVKTSSQPMIAGGMEGKQKTATVAKETVQSMNEAVKDFGKDVSGKAETLKFKSQDMMEGTMKNVKDRIDHEVGSIDTFTQSLGEPSGISKHLSVEEPPDIAKKTITETVGKTTGDGVTVPKKIVETPSASFKVGKIVVEKTISEAKQITADVGQAVQDFGEGMMEKSNGTKSKGKNKMETAKQAIVVSEADAKVSDVEALAGPAEGLLKCLTNQKLKDFSSSVAETSDTQKTTVTEIIESTDNGITTLRKPSETSLTPGKETVQKITTSTKDIVEGAGESMQSFGKGLMGKIGGKKGNGKHKMETVKQTALTTTDTIGSEVGSVAESAQDTMKSMGQKLVDSTGSVLETLEAGITKVSDTTKMSTQDDETIKGKTLETASKPIQETEQKSTPKETQADEVSKAINDFGKDAMGKLSGKKAKRKQKMEASKQKLEAAAGNITSEVGAVAESVKNTIKSIGGKVADSTTSVVDLAANSTKVGSQQITSLKDEGINIIEKTVATASKPAEGTVQKTTTVTTEIAGNEEHRAQKIDEGLIGKAEGLKENDQDKSEGIKRCGMLTTKETVDCVKTDIGATERQASSVGTNTAKSLDTRQEIITETIQKKADDGRVTIQQTIRMIESVPGEKDNLTEKTIAVTRDLEGDAEQMLTKVTTSETFRPQLHAQTSDVAVFETLETSSLEDRTYSAASSTDEIGRIIKEMESQLLKTKFEVDESGTEESSEMESEDSARECRTMPATPMPTRKGFTHEVDDASDIDSKPVVTTPTLSRQVTGIGGSQRLLPAERPVVRVITEYVGDQHESEPEDDTTYTVLEPEVRERRKFKIRFSPDMYESEEKDYADTVEVEEISSKAKLDSKKSEKTIKHMEKKFERMTSQTTEADPSMTEATNSEFQSIVSQLSLEDMDQALHQWDIGGLTPSEGDSKDLTLSSEDTASPLQQGLSDIFRPKLSSILPTPVYMEKTGTEVGSSTTPESSKMKLSLVKDSVPQIFQSVETESNIKGESIKTEQEQKQTVEPTGRERDEETQEGATGYTESRAKGSKQEKTPKK